MPGLNVHLPPPEKPKPSRPWSIIYFLTTFIAIFIGTYLVIETLKLPPG